MISGRKVGGQRSSKKFSLSEGHPKQIRKQMGHLKDTIAAQKAGQSGDNAMNMVPTFEEAARVAAASDQNPTGNQS